MKWKEEFLKPLSTGIKQSTHFHKIRQKEYTTLTLRTTNHSYFTRLRKMFYPEGKKRIKIQSGGSGAGGSAGKGSSTASVKDQLESMFKHY